MNIKKCNTLVRRGVYLVLSSPSVALAQLPTSVADIQRSIENLVKHLINIFWVVAVGFIVWAAFTFLSAQGEPEKIKKAKTRLIYAVVAAMIVLLANGIQAIVTSILQGR